MNHTTPNTSNLRALAASIVHQVKSQESSLSTLLPRASQSLSPKDKGLLQEMVFGTCRWYFLLEKQYQPLLHKPFGKRLLVAEALLAVGAYQLFFMRVAQHAALNETVAATEDLKLKSVKGVINAILRQLSKREIEIDAQAHRMSHPNWMIEKLSHNWPDLANEVFAQNNEHPPMTLRVNQSKTSREAYLERLNEAGISAKACQWAPQGILLEQAQNVANLPGFSEGLCSVQDEAAQLCVDLLDLEPGMRVLDACAAPGGKTCAMLEKQPDLAMTALDNEANRAKKIQENLQRLEQNASMVVANAEEIEDWWDGEVFDRILLDAPCSATGVIRRHPDIKLLRREGDIPKLADLQLKILSEVWKTLKSGGKLLYATCSVFPQENSRIVERFITQEASATLITIDADWGINTGFGHQLFPKAHGHDGFFYACLKKR